MNLTLQARKRMITLVRLVFLALFLAVILSGKMVLWLVLFAISLPLAIFFGRIYCGYACPMNAVMIGADWLATRTVKDKKRRRQAPDWLKKGYLPWILLIITIAALLLSRRLLKVNLPLLPFYVLLSCAVTLFYKPEVFHRFICPFGALQRLFGKLARRTHQVLPASCTGCRKCVTVCPSLAVSTASDTRKAVIEKRDCLQCQNCSLVCPTHAIQYSKAQPELQAVTEQTRSEPAIRP